jgi:hypothetical protein
MDSTKAFETEEAFEEALRKCETKEDFLKLILGPADGSNVILQRKRNLRVPKR